MYVNRVRNRRKERWSDEKADRGGAAFSLHAFIIHPWENIATQVPSISNETKKKRHLPRTRFRGFHVLRRIRSRMNVKTLLLLKWIYGTVDVSCVQKETRKKNTIRKLCCYRESFMDVCIYVHRNYELFLIGLVNWIL